MSRGFLQALLVVLALAFAQLTMGWGEAQETPPGKPDARSAQPRLVVQFGHSELITSIAVSPDGRMIATASWDAFAILWDVATGREVRRFKHPGKVEHVAFSPDSRLIFTGSGSGSHFWDVSTGREVLRFKEHATGGELFTEFALSPDGRFILTGDWNNNAWLWDAATGRPLRQLSHPGKINSVAFSPDGRFALTGWFDAEFLVNRGSRAAGASLWDLARGQEVRRFLVDDNLVSTVAISPDGRFAATGTSGGSDTNAGRAVLWDIAAGRSIQVFEGHSLGVRSIAFSPAGTLILATGDNDGMTRLWDAATGIEIRKFKGDLIAVTSTAFSLDGRFIVTGGNSHSAHIWEVRTGEENHHLTGVSSPVHAAVFSPDDRFIVTGMGGGELEGNAACLWDTGAGSEVQRFQHPVPVGALAFSPDATLVAITGVTDFLERASAVVTEEQMQKDGVHLWNVEAGQQVRRFKDGGAPIAFSPDGRFIAMRDSSSRVTDMAVRSILTGTVTRRFFEKIHEVDVASVAFSPDGRSILTGEGGDMVSGVMTLWSAATGRAIRRFNPADTGLVGESSFPAVAFSPDGRFVLGGARLWQTATGESIRRFGAPDRRQIESSTAGNIGAYSPDGRLIATDHGNVISLWDAATGRELNRLEGHLRPVKSIAFSHAGRFIVSGSEDGTALLWEVSTGTELCRLVSFSTGDWVAVAPDGRFDTNNLEDIKGVHWVVPDDPLQPLPIEIFMRDYYEPRLLARILAGEQLPPIRQLSELNRVQPHVKMANIERQKDRPDLVTVTVEVGRRGSELQKDEKGNLRQTGVYDLRLFRDGQIVGQHSDGTPQALAQSAADNEKLLAWRNENEVRLDGTGKRTIKFENIKLPRRAVVNQVKFSAYAFNEDRVKSQTGRMSFEIPAEIAPTKGRAYIISVGVNAYENHAFNLRYSVNDARAVQRAIFERLSKTGDYAHIVQVPLISDYEVRLAGRTIASHEATSEELAAGEKVLTNELATKSNFKAVVDLLAGRYVDPETMKAIPNSDKLRQASPEDLVLISFSSHGYADSDGNFFFVLSDTGAGASEKVTEELLKRLSPNFLSSEELSLWLRDVDAGEMMMIVDACHSAAAVQGREFKPGPMGSRGLGQLSYDKGMRILTATQAEDVAYGIGALKQGLLTYVLVKEGLEEGRADFKPADRRITASEWLQYGEQGVPKLLVEIRKKARQPNAPVELRDLVQKTTADALTQRPSLFDFSRKRREVVLVK